MKKITFLLLAFLSLNVFAQKNIVWFDCGLKVQAGAGGFYNKAVGDSKNFNHEISYSSGLSYGGKIGINWQYNGISIEAYSAKGSQALENLGDVAKAPTYAWKSTDVYTLYRNAKNLGYFELGPKVSFLNKATQTLGSSPETSVKDNFNKMNYAGVLGFGANVLGSDGRFSGILGLRFEYGFTDIYKSGSNLLDLTPRATTNPYFAGIVFEANWGIGYFGKAQCGARSKFIMF